MVEMTIDLLRLAITLQQTTKDPHSSHPQHFLGHASILSTLPLTVAGVSALPAGLRVLTNARPRMDGNRLLDDKAVADELADVLA